MSTLVALSLLCFGFGSMSFVYAKSIFLSAWDMMVANGVFYAAGDFGYGLLVTFVTLFLLVSGFILLVSSLMRVSNGLKMVILTEVKVMFGTDLDLDMPDAIS